MATLLPAEALRGTRIGISVSESPDLEQLGLLEIHFRLALAEIARCVLVSGGTLAYGGHLSPDGYTTFVMQELQKYGRRDSPLLVCLAWQEHRKLKLSELRASQEDLGLLGRIVLLGVDDGNWLPHRTGGPPDDPRWMVGQARLVDRAKQEGWSGLNNGLTDDENRRLAASHRPSDIAALVSLGLGRLRHPTP